MSTGRSSEIVQPKIQFFLARNGYAKNMPLLSPSLQPCGKGTLFTFSEAPQSQRKENNRIMIITATCTPFIKLELEGEFANVVIEQTNWRQALPS